MSVLKGMKPRVSGNIQSKETFDIKEEKRSNVAAIKESIEKNTKKDKKSKYENQTHQIKVSAKLKEEINALKNITKTKFDYEILELLIDSYNKNELNPTQRRKFKTLTDDEF